MERLTRNGFDYCAEYCASGADYGFFKHEVPTPCGDAAIYNRLAAYEDTGLEPEEILGPYDNLKAHLFDVEQELGKYKQAEAEGCLLVLPCKVGDTVYTAQRGVVSELYVGHLEFYNTGIWVGWSLISGIYGNFRMDGFPASDIGKTVFLTRKEAEAALAKECEKQ